MSNDHHSSNGHNENKPVAFTAPLILGGITIFIILLFVSLGNPCQANCCREDQECSEECKEACDKKHLKDLPGVSHSKESIGTDNPRKAHGVGNTATTTATDSTQADHDHADHGNGDGHHH